jgi:ABC-type amino acid transport system permease subunit
MGGDVMPWGFLQGAWTTIRIIVVAVVGGLVVRFVLTI